MCVGETVGIECPLGELVFQSAMGYGIQQMEESTGPHTHTHTHTHTHRMAASANSPSGAYLTSNGDSRPQEWDVIGTTQ